MKLFNLIILVLLVSPLLLFSQRTIKYNQGELLIGVRDGIFNFPLEYYGAKISYSSDSSQIEIDSLYHITLKEGLRQI